MNIEIIVLAGLAWLISVFAVRTWVVYEEMLEEINGTDE
jgi:hypothetical protein